MRITFHPPKPGDGCPGMHTLNGRLMGLCTTCTRLGGRELEPVARTTGGLASCVNHHPMSVGVHNAPAQATDRGAPSGVSSTDTAQTGGVR